MLRRQRIKPHMFQKHPPPILEKKKKTKQNPRNSVKNRAFKDLLGTEGVKKTENLDWKRDLEKWVQYNFFLCIMPRN